MRGKRGGLVCNHQIATLAAALLSWPAAWCAPPPPAPEVNITGSPWRPGQPLFIQAPLPDTGVCLGLLLCQTCVHTTAGEAVSAELKVCTRRWGVGHKVRKRISCLLAALQDSLLAALYLTACLLLCSKCSLNTQHYMQVCKLRGA